MVPKQFSIDCAITMAAFALNLCHQCHVFYFAVPAGWLLLANFLLFQTGTVTACAARVSTIPPLLCHDAIIVSHLLALVLLANCCLKKCSWETITCWMVRAAAMLPPLCHDGDAITIVPLKFCLAYAGTVATGWLLITFFVHTMTSSVARAAAMPPSL